MTADNPAPNATSPQRLCLKQISKSYRTPVLRSIDLDLKPGEIRALVGANGAGKSTLAKVIAGLVRPDSGHLVLNGHSRSGWSKLEAEANGVHLVQQELNLIPTLTVAENLFFNQLPHRWSFVNWRELNSKAATALARVGLRDLDPRTRAGRLGIGQQQLVEIASALARDAQVLILDEPTAALTQPQIDTLFTQLNRLRASGVSMLYVSHRMDEIRTLTDTVTILRDGQVVLTKATPELTATQTVQAMIGKQFASQGHRPGPPPGEVLLQVKGLTAANGVRDASLHLHRHEIVGLAGLVGAGRTELLRAIFGADRATSGTIELPHRQRSSHFSSPRQAVRAGIGMVPEDRKSQGLLLSRSIADNVLLGNEPAVCDIPGIPRTTRIRQAVQDVMQRMEVLASGMRQPVEQLSGGNQQKVLLGRWAQQDCDILLLDEPTRGVDVAAKATVHERLFDWRDQGRGLLVVSSELEELQMLCDRILVMRHGTIVGEFSRRDFDHSTIMGLAIGDPATNPTPTTETDDSKQAT